MDNENLLPEEARAVITQNGDRNIAVAHAENINITIVAPSPQDEQACHLVRWGDVEITHAEAKLLDEFLNDYDAVIIECIKTDFSCPGININLLDMITIPYHEKWDATSLKFRQPRLRSAVLETISVLNELTGYLGADQMRLIPDYPREKCLVPINDSWEAGCWVREVLRPETEKLRYKLRDLYRTLHPDDYVGTPEFTDHYEAEPE